MRIFTDAARKKSAFLVSYIASRRTDKAAYGMLFLILAHIKAKERLAQKLGKTARKLGFSDAGRSDEQKTGIRSVWIFMSGTGALYRLYYGRNCFTLPENLFFKKLL